MKKSLKLMSLLLVVVMLIGALPAGFVAASANASGVVVSLEEDSLSIQNAYLQRTFALPKVITTSIVNFICEDDFGTFVPGPKSEEFVIGLRKATTTANPDTAVDAKIKASDLTLVGEPVVKTLDGKSMVTFNFAPFTALDVAFTISYNAVMGDGDNFMRTFLEIDVPEEDAAKVKLIYIDTDAYDLSTVDMSRLFCRPTAVWRQYLSNYMTGLGQPVYINSFFMGVEFVAADSKITPNPDKGGDAARSLLFRYYNGKTFDKLEKADNGKFVSWPELVGTARTSQYPVVQDDFYTYIESIATETPFRSQYNTWYDSGMNLSPYSITNSFMRIEQGLTQAGLPPIDSYVCDDGYNDYTGSFWGFKPSFANNVLKNISDMMTRAGGHFGLWISPRGGYGTPGDFARFMELAGTGYYASGGNICVAAPKYQANLLEHMCDYQRNFNVNYWKIDGLANAPCNNANHGHMVNGINEGFVPTTGLNATQIAADTDCAQTAANSSVFFYTELWENWYKIFDGLKASAKADGGDVFLNCTSFSIPSPWILQHVNTVYIQVSSDHSQVGPASVPWTDRMMSYRDGRYYMFYVNNKFQLPPAHIWNHDPVYGRTAPSFVAVEDDVFRRYMYNNALRGSSLYEVYFTPESFNEGKWMATAEAMTFAREKYDILRNMKMITPFGAPGPDSGSVDNDGLYNPYAYSAWVEDEGYVMFRNPKWNTTVEFSLVLDRLAGVKEGMKDLYMTLLCPNKLIDEGAYSYGDTLTMTLNPLDVVIMKFAKKDTVAPNVVRTEVMDEQTLRVYYDEPINLTDEMLDGIVVSDHDVVGASLLIDSKVVEISIADAFVNNEAISATLTVQDYSRNAAEATVSARFAEGRIINQFAAAADLSADAAVAFDAVMNRDVLTLDKNVVGFSSPASADETDKLTLSMMIKTTGGAAAVLAQEGAYDVALNDAGKVIFTVGDLVATSMSSVNDGNWHLVTCVKEPNQMIKIYVDGIVDASAYNGSAFNILKAGAITIGSADFVGQISQIIVANKPYGWLEVQALADANPLGGYKVNGTASFTLAGMAPSLPKTVKANYDGSGYFRNYETSWDALAPEAYATAGKVEVGGSIPSFGNLALSDTLSVIDSYPKNDPLTSVIEGKWTILNENKANYALNPGSGTNNGSGLRIVATPSHMDRGGKDNENFFLLDTGMDDFCATVDVYGAPTRANHSAGLIFYQDDDNFVRMTRRISGTSGNGSINVVSLNVQNNGYIYTIELPCRTIADANYTAAQLYLALDKKGDFYTGYYSTDNVNWIKLGTVQASLASPLVGFHATIGVDNIPNLNYVAYQPRFNNFTIRQYAVGLKIAEIDAKVPLASGVNVPQYIWADATLSDGAQQALLVELPAIDVNGVIPAYVMGTVVGQSTQVKVDLNITKVESYKLNVPARLTLKKGTKYDLGAVAVVEHYNANIYLSYASSNATVANVTAKGVIQALKVGSAVIAVKDAYTGTTAAVLVTVN